MPSERTELTEEPCLDEEVRKRLTADVKAQRMLQQGDWYLEQGKLRYAREQYETVADYGKHVSPFLHTQAYYSAAQANIEEGDKQSLIVARNYIGKIPGLLEVHFYECINRENARQISIEKYSKLQQGPASGLPIADLRDIVEMMSNRIESDYRQTRDIFYRSGQLLISVENKLKSLEDQKRLEEEKAKEFIRRGDLGTLYTNKHESSKAKANKGSQKGKGIKNPKKRGR